MKIEKIIYQYRRDFTAIYVCQGCGNTQEGRGYDDANFHQNVIPSIRCAKCGKSTEDMDIDYIPLNTKYPEGYQI